MSQTKPTIKPSIDGLSRRPKRVCNTRRDTSVESINLVNTQTQPQQQSSAAQKTSLRVRSASVGRSRDHDLRCRYWAFLFDNLNRAVDEIYQNCEKDESIVECKEAIMVLDNYRREFMALIEWLNLNIDYESTPPPERPNSVTWEVRKSNAKQMTFWNTFFNKNSENSLHNSIYKSLNNNNRTGIDIQLIERTSSESSSEEKENIKIEKSTKILNKSENKVIEEVVTEKQTQIKDNKPNEDQKSISKTTESDKSNDKPVIVEPVIDKHVVNNTGAKQSNNNTKPLNPLAQSFKSRLHSITTPTSNTTAAPAVVQTPQQQSTATVTNKTAAATVPFGAKPVPTANTNPKPVVSTKVVATVNSQAPPTTTTNLIKRTIVSTPDLSAINTNNNNTNSKPLIKDQSTQQQSSRKLEPKISVSVQNKNFTKETNSSRAKNVRNNTQIGVKSIQKSNSNKSLNNILSTRNQNVRQINSNLHKTNSMNKSLNNLSNNSLNNNKNNLQNNKLINNSLNGLNNNKYKKIKDADGWEVVRGRQRYKASPPKVIIVEDESVVKTTADGTVIAVTAASQTNDNWDPMCSSWPNSQSAVDTELLRTPGRALKMHEKLSSPSRKRNASPTESIKRHEEKLAKAQEAREKLLEEKAQKFKGIVKKVESMKAWKEEQQMQRKLELELKLQRAEEKRQKQLNEKVRKAHDEDSKVNEIQFINSLEAQNKMYDILSREKDLELRLQDLHEERHRKMEEKQAKETAAEERRKALEEERQQRIIELQQRRKLKDQKIEQQFQEKEKERLEMATQKALDRQTRLTAINALYAQNKEDLQKKIRQKQDESKRRHEENMEQIRQKALELSVRKSSSVGNDEAPICEPYDTMKMCQLCQVIIKSEVFLFGHLRGKRHNDAICEQNGGKVPTNKELENYNIKYIMEAPTDLHKKSIQSCENERLKAARKRSKKLKQRLISKANQFESNCGQKVLAIDSKQIQSNNKNKISKLFKDLNTLSADTQITGQWPQNMIHSLERVLNELEKLFRNNKSPLNRDSLYFQSLNGSQLLTKLLSRIMNGNKERPTSLTDRANAKLATIYELICGQHSDVSDYVLQSKDMIELLDILCHRINLSDANLISFANNSTTRAVTYDPVIGALCRLLSTIFDSLYSHYSIIAEKTDDCLTFNQLIQDVISYIVSIGMIDKLSLFMSNTRGPIDEWPDLAQFLQNIISLFSSISKLMTLKVDNSFGAKLAEDETQLMITLQTTHICGVVSLIYGLLLHSGAPVRTGDDIPPPLAANHTMDLTLEAIRFINYVSLLDLTMIQCVLGGEGLSLQIRHICSYLLWYCSHHKCPHLLNEVILLIGNFVVLNNDNQTLLESGQRPTIVKQLCCLPFEYFSDEKLSSILFPTLIVCCFHNSQNRTVLEQEMSTLMLSSFIESTIVGLQLRAVDSQYMSQKTNDSLAKERLSFAKRFPKNRWNEAKDYFEAQSRSID